MAEWQNAPVVSSAPAWQNAPAVNADGTDIVEEKKPSVMSRLWTAISGDNADPSIPASIKEANLGLSPAEAARMTALFATTRSPDRLRAGITAIEPETEFGEDESGRLYAVFPVRRDGEKTGQFTRFYPNEPGLGLMEGMQVSGAAALAGPVGKVLQAVGLPTSGAVGAAAIGATEAAVIEGASSTLTGEPFQITDVPIGAAGGVAGEKMINIVGSLVAAARRGGAERILGPDGKLLPGPAKYVTDAGLDPAQVSAAVAADIQSQVRRGIEPNAAAVTAQSRNLPMEVPMTRGQITGSKGQQLQEDALGSGAYGEAAERSMAGFRALQQDALRQNMTNISEGLAPGSPPIARNQGAELAQQALVAARAGDKAQATALYQRARASGQASIEPDQAIRMTDGARAAYTEGFNPRTAPTMSGMLDDLEQIMNDGGDIRELNEWRKQVSNLRSGGPTVEGAAASAVLRQFDDDLTQSVNNQLLIGDQQAVDAWKEAISNWSTYAKTWETNGGILNLLTEQVTRDGTTQLKVAPEAAANAIFTITASGLANRTGLARDLVTLKGRLPEREWNALRQEAFVRLTDVAEGAFRNGDQQVSGVKFKKAWTTLLNNNPGVANALFSQAERETIGQFADVAARATNSAVNASNSANMAAGMIQRVAGAFGGSGAGQFMLQNQLARLIREPYGAAAAITAQQTREAPRQIVNSAPRSAAVGAGAGAAVSQEENITSVTPGGRMTIGGAQ